MALQTKEEDYYQAIANKVELNRCPHCNVGMNIHTECIRRCPKCGYKEDSNVPFKAKIKFKIYQEPKQKECTVAAFEPNGKLSFQKEFQDIFTAERYVDRVKVICLPF